MFRGDKNKKKESFLDHLSWLSLVSIWPLETKLLSEEYVTVVYIPIVFKQCMSDRLNYSNVCT